MGPPGLNGSGRSAPGSVSDVLEPRGFRSPRNMGAVLPGDVAGGPVSGRGSASSLTSGEAGQLELAAAVEGRFAAAASCAMGEEAADASSVAKRSSRESTMVV